MSADEAFTSSPAKLGRCRRHTATEGSRGATLVETAVHVGAMKGFEDGFEDAVRLRDNVVVPEAKDMKTADSQERIAMRVVGRSLDMLAAVKFDNETCFKTGKIGDVAADTMLPTKLESSQLAPTQVLPKQVLGFGWIAAKCSHTVQHRGTGASFVGESAMLSQLERALLTHDPSGPLGHLPTAWGGGVIQ